MSTPARDRGAETTLDRRTVLRGVTGLATVGAAGVASTGTAAAQPSFGGWMDDARNYEEVVDRTGQDTVTVDVGAGVGLSFGPAAIRIDPGTTIEFDWTGQGVPHNVHAMEGADFQSDLISESGVHFTHTFEEAGIVKYQCDPHAASGMKGVVVVGDVEIPDGGGSQPTATPTGGDGSDGDGGSGRPAFPGYVDDANVGSYLDARGQDEVTIEVGAGTGLAFDPTTVWIDSGTTVTWEWTGQGGGHNVVSNSGPAEFDSGDTVSEAGTTFQHTFETGGITSYYCEPHEGAGMKGAIAVGPDVPMAQQGGGDDGFSLPTDATGTALLGAILGITGLAALLVLATETYGSMGRGEPRDETESTSTTAADPDEGIVREIGHDDFDPVGTATLIALYVAIVVGLWVFMYFVEFLNNGPTVMG